MTQEQFELEIGDDDLAPWCAVDWCLARASVYLDGGELWWPACETHVSLATKRLARYGTLGVTKLRVVASNW